MQRQSMPKQHILRAFLHIVGVAMIGNGIWMVSFIMVAHALGHVTEILADGYRLRIGGSISR